MRVLPAVLVVLVLGAIGWLLGREWKRESVEPAVAARSVAPAPEVAPLAAPATVAPLEPSRIDEAEAPKPKHGLIRSLLGGDDDAEREEDAEPRGESIRVVGSVIVVDRNGVEHAREDGTLAPLFVTQRPSADGDGTSWSGEWGDQVEVRDGAFEVDVPQGKELGVRVLKLADRLAVVDERSFEVAPGTPIAIRARWVENVLLRVRDAASGAELSDVTVMRVRDWQIDDCPHPGALDPEHVVVEHESSPVELQPDEKLGHRMNDEFWVYAAGHAWGQVAIDFEEQAEAEVRLGPGASLIVAVRGELPAPVTAPRAVDLASRLLGAGSHIRSDDDGAPRLRLRALPADDVSFDAMIAEALEGFEEATADDFPGGVKPSLEQFKALLEQDRAAFEAYFELGEMVMERPAALGEIRIDGLEPGERQVSVEIGRSWDQPLVVGSIPVSLRAHETTHASLVLAPQAPPAAAVPLAGTIYVPSSWDAGELELEIDPIDLRGRTQQDERDFDVDELPEIAGRPGWRRWDAGMLRPARYQISISETCVESIVELVAPGRTDVEIVVPEAATLIVHVVDDATGAPLSLADATTWWQVVREGVFDFGGSTTHHGVQDGLIRMRVPVGKGALELHADEWRAVHAPNLVEIHAGEQETTVRLERACGITFELECGGTPLSWPDDGPDVEVEAVAHDGAASRWSWGSDSGLRIQVTKPGRYRVVVPEISGYLPIEPFELDLAPGEFLTHVIELRRRP